MRCAFAILVLFVGLGVSGCAGSDPEPPAESVPEVPAGRTMPGAEGGGGAPPMPAPPQ